MCSICPLQPLFMTLSCVLFFSTMNRTYSRDRAVKVNPCWRVKSCGKVCYHCKEAKLPKKIAMAASLKFGPHLRGICHEHNCKRNQASPLSCIQKLWSKVMKCHFLGLHLFFIAMAGLSWSLKVGWHSTLFFPTSYTGDKYYTSSASFDTTVCMKMYDIYFY
jgi:hypothetical protein